MNATTNAWADMADDIPFSAAPTAPWLAKRTPEERAAEAVRAHTVTRQEAPEVYKDVCPKCGGSGRYGRFGKCFACEGAGYRTYKTPPEQRERARVLAAERAERERQERAEWQRAWREEHRDVVQWIDRGLQRYPHPNEFALSLSESLAHYGSLTEGQVAAVRRAIERDAERAQERAQAKAAQPQASDMLPKLHDVMQRHAKFYAGDLTLSRRNADQLVWIKHAAAEKVIGKLDNGRLSLWQRPGVDLGAVRAVLDEFEGAPLQAAMRYGKLAGRCCSCGRELTDPASIEAGIGPICADKFA
jgi:hypothetical protein